MAYYIGLDVSQKNTAVCIVDSSGKIVKEGSCLTRPQDIYGWVSNRVEVQGIIKVGLEATNLSSWLYTQLTKLGLPMVCLETFQAHRFISTQRNKTDKNDARGLAQLVRMGEDFLKLVTVRSQASQEARALLALREHLVHHKRSLENHIAGIVKPFGLIVARGNVCAGTFRDRVVEALCLAEDQGIRIRSLVMPSLDLYREACAQLALLTKQVETIASHDPVCKRLMTVPGIGPVVALSFMTAVDESAEFFVYHAGSLSWKSIAN